jgi:hypothetical protein
MLFMRMPAIGGTLGNVRGKDAMRPVLPRRSRTRDRGCRRPVDVIPEERSEDAPIFQAPTCQHHWIIESPSGPTSIGRCKLCGAERQFPNSAEGPLRQTTCLLCEKGA